MENVILLKCRSYSKEEVSDAVDKVFEYLGGVEKFIKPGMKVLIKQIF